MALLQKLAKKASRKRKKQRPTKKRSPTAVTGGRSKRRGKASGLADDLDSKRKKRTRRGRGQSRLKSIALRL